MQRGSVAWALGQMAVSCMGMIAVHQHRQSVRVTLGFILAASAAGPAFGDAIACLGAPKAVGSWDYEFRNSCSDSIRFVLKSISPPPDKKTEFTAGYISAAPNGTSSIDSYFNTAPVVVWACIVGTAGCSPSDANNARDRLAQNPDGASSQMASDILRRKRAALSSEDGEVTDTHYIDASGMLVIAHVVTPETKYNQSTTWHLKLNAVTQVAPRDVWSTNLATNKLVISRIDAKDPSLQKVSWTQTIVIDSDSSCHVANDTNWQCALR
jgi:hypothetical protein